MGIFYVISIGFEAYKHNIYLILGLLCIPFLGFERDMAIIKITGFECERCGHKWCPKSINQSDPDSVLLPTICPKCKSPYWNKPRKNKSMNSNSL